MTGIKCHINMARLARLTVVKPLPSHFLKMTARAILGGLSCVENLFCLTTGGMKSQPGLGKMVL